ncbi:membrane protein [Legionella impletisoli]|uniref:Membrane protein n=2 Tax=Legionella impletisoli TaxID=343510 RepID=A0A917N9A0_9GAMM|nr:membrane protein [Legionella impletisoli]
MVLARISLITSCLTLVIILIALPVQANTKSPWYTVGPDQQVTLHVDLFMSSTCPHCHKADEYFKEVAPNYPWLKFERHIIDKDKAALKLFYERLQSQDVNNFAVPAFFFCDSRWVGFADAERSGKPLLNAMTYCRDEIKKYGTLPQATISVLRAKGSASQYEIDSWIARNPQLFIPLSGLMDAVTPCSLFIYLVLFAFVSLYPGFKNQQAMIGIIFITTLWILTYFKLAFTNLYYEWFNALRWIANAFGLIFLLYLVFYGFRSQLKINKPMPRIWPFIILTTVFVFSYQQFCLMNVGLIFEQWLIGQSLTSLQRVTYLFMYSLFYIIPFILFFLIYFFSTYLKRMQSYHKQLYISAWVFLLGVAIILLLKPIWLSKLIYSYVVLLIALLVGWILPYWRSRHEEK